MDVVILGCGNSSSVPSVRCLLTRKNCAVCHEAHANPDSKNRRLNPSILVRNLLTNTNVLVDCGKTFREAALRIFPDIGVSEVHAVVLTHDHADACLGLDDLRDVQSSEETEYSTISQPFQVHCSPSTSTSIRARFSYLMAEEPPPEEIVEEEPYRWTAKLAIDVFEPWKPFEASGIKFTPFPVIHGDKYTSFGFEFGQEVGARFVYISDVSVFPEQTKRFLNDKSKAPIDVLLIDSLYMVRHHITHMSLLDVMKEIETIRPKLTLLTGMSHEFDYAKHNPVVIRMGEERGLRVKMAYDGLCLSFP